MPGTLRLQYGPSQGYAYGALFGDWAALAADHTRTPEQLLGAKAGDVVVSYPALTGIAVTNYRHFHPVVVTSWREDHLRSLQAAAGAANAAGIEMVSAFERGLAIQAFASHYLQDSFSSGHMGFNRTASSNAAALSYHNRVSMEGRCVADLAGNEWFTFGDGKLFDAGDVAVNRVVEAARRSLADFLETFVTSEVSTSRWEEAWILMPALMQEPPTAPATQCQADVGFRSLRTMHRPAEARVTYDLTLFADETLDRRGITVQGLLVGASRDFVYTIPVGSYRTIHNRIFGAIGTTTRQIGPRALIVDYGYVWHVGTTNRGTLAHEIGVAQQFYTASRASDRRSSVRAMYALNIEAGRAYLRLQAGPAYRLGRWKTYASAGVGWVHKSKQ